MELLVRDDNATSGKQVIPMFAKDEPVIDASPTYLRAASKEEVHAFFREAAEMAMGERQEKTVRLYVYVRVQERNEIGYNPAFRATKPGKYTLPNHPLAEFCEVNAAIVFGWQVAIVQFFE